MAKVTGCPSLEMTVEGFTSFCNESSSADDTPEVSEVIAKRSKQRVHAPSERTRHSLVCRPLSLPHALFILHQELDRWDCKPRAGLIRILEEVANEAVCGACEILRLRLGFPHFCPALSLGLGDPLTGFFAQDTFTSPVPVRMTEGT